MGKVRNVIAHLSHANPEFKHPFLVERDTVKRAAMIVIPQTKVYVGLNTNVLRAAWAHYKKLNLMVRKLMYAVSVLGLNFMQRAGANIISSLTPVGDKPKLED